MWCCLYITKEYINSGSTTIVLSNGKYLEDNECNNLKYDFSCTKPTLAAYPSQEQTLHLCPAFWDLNEDHDSSDEKKTAVYSQISLVGMMRLLFLLQKKASPFNAAVNCRDLAKNKGDKINLKCINVFLGTTSVYIKYKPLVQYSRFKIADEVSSVVTDNKMAEVKQLLEYTLKFQNFVNLPMQLQWLYSTVVNGNTENRWQVFYELIEKINTFITTSSSSTYIENGATLKETICKKITDCDGTEIETTGHSVYYTTSNLPSSIFLCNSYISSSDIHVHALIHELSHIAAKTDDTGISGCSVYGYDECSANVNLTKDKPEYTTIIADCLALFIVAGKSYLSSIQQKVEERKMFPLSINKNNEAESMTKITTIALNTDVKVTYHRNVDVTLNLQNNDNIHDYYISGRALLLNWSFGSFFPFTIDGPSVIPCRLNTLHVSKPPLVKLIKDGGVVQNEIRLSDICNFKAASSGIYILKYNATMLVYNNENQEFYTSNQGPQSEEYVHLVSQSRFVIGEDSHDLALASLDYGSAL